jgi:hypothetical protein
MVIAREAFITELEKNDDFRRRHSEKQRMKREKEEAARRFVEQYNRIIEEAAKETEGVIDKKLKEKGLESGDIEDLKCQVIYEMPAKYSTLANHPDRADCSRTSSYVKVMKDVAALLIPRYVSQGWILSYRHIKGGIFIFSVE